MKTLYQTEVVVNGGRDGHAESKDGHLKVDLTVPKELGGAAKPGATNPEQLFGAGYAACFESAIRFVARKKKVNIQNSAVTAIVSLSANPAGEGFVLGLTLKVNLPEIERETAQAIVDDAHKVCPYSNATRGSLDVKIELV